MPPAGVPGFDHGTDAEWAPSRGAVCYSKERVEEHEQGDQFISKFILQAIDLVLPLHISQGPRSLASLRDTVRYLVQGLWQMARASGYIPTDDLAVPLWPHCALVLDLGGGPRNWRRPPNRGGAVRSGRSHMFFWLSQMREY